MSQEQYKVRTTERSLDIIEYLKDNRRSGVTDIANNLGLSKSVVHNHLQTLRERDYIIQTSNGYELSHKFLNIGGIQNWKTDIFKVARKELHALAYDTGERANLMVEEDGRGVVIMRAFGASAIDADAYSGQFVPLHATALGKAYLSQLPEADVDALLDDTDLDAWTKSSVTTRKELMKHLRVTRDRGFAIECGEYFDGIVCVAVPILDEKGEITASIGLSMPSGKVPKDGLKGEIADRLKSSKNKIEIELRFQD